MNTFKKILDKLSGCKSYFIAALIGLISAAKFLGWIDEATFGVLFGLLTGGGLAALRSGIEKSQSCPVNQPELK